MDKCKYNANVNGRMPLTSIRKSQPVDNNHFPSSLTIEPGVKTNRTIYLHANITVLAFSCFYLRERKMQNQDLCNTQTHDVYITLV